MTLVVNGEKIEDTAIQQEAERLRPEYEKAFADMDIQEREVQLLDWSKDNIIERILLRQEAKQNTSNIDESEVELFLLKLKEQYAGEQSTGRLTAELYDDFYADNEEKLREAIEVYLVLAKKVKDICKDLPKPSNAEIRQYYQENKENFRNAEQVRVAHIVKYVNWQTSEASAYEQIREAQNELRKGVPFETVVEKYTDCTDTGGDIGYIARGEMAEEFEDVVFNLDVGQVSDIFRTRFGFHIAKVYDRTKDDVSSLEEVRGQIREKLKEQSQEKAIEQFIDQLRSTAHIEEI
jgi:parvulin-like peptidyl-prolyl isomerase